MSINPETMQEIAVFNFVAVFFILLNLISFWAPIVRRVMRGPVWWVALVAFLLYWIVIGVRAYLNPVPWGLVVIVGMGIAASMTLLQMRIRVRPREEKQ
jgi:apolipoprotein N-acyltransferase